MSRLQKKCLIAVAGAHLLVVVVILCSGFMRPKPKADDSQILDVIPSKLVDAAFNSGVQNAPPPPTPPVQPQPQPQPPQQEPPKPEVKPVEPVKPVTLPRPIEPEVTRPEIPVETKPQPQHKIEINLKPVVRKNTTETDNSEAQAKAAKEAKRIRDERARAIRTALNNIKANTSSSTTIEMPGTGSVSYANYASVVKSIYEREWETPQDASNDEANTRVSITIRRDGTVISSHILTPSGDSKVDASVQQTLDRVNFIAPFPDGATENEKEFIIVFNLKLKRMQG